MARVLVAEDDPLQAELISRYLLREGHEVTVVATGDAALEAIRRLPPQLLLLDVMLPGQSGLDVSRILREEGDRTPILMLTARSTENDLLLGLELGADDYLAKPYSPRELVARIRALLRRAGEDAAPSAQLRAGGLLLDPRRRSAAVDGRELELTRAEWDLLAELTANAEAVLSRSQLLSALHGMDRYIGERTIDTHVRNLRRKIETDPAHPVRLLTVYGVGYRLTAI